MPEGRLQRTRDNYQQPNSLLVRLREERETADILRGYGKRLYETISTELLNELEAALAEHR